MTLDELQILLDISSGNEIEILKQHTNKTSYGYLFVDSSDEHCHLLDRYGHLDDMSKVKCIQDYVFWYCTSLKNITIPDSVKSIGRWAFWYCKSLENITIPNSVESIGNNVFEYCTSLKNITIPDSIESIGYGAFEYCKSLKEVIFKGKMISQVKAIDNYPWGIKNTSIIKC